MRAYSFRPNTNASVITGIVFWDEVQYAQNFTVTVSRDGTAVDDVSLN